MVGGYIGVGIDTYGNFSNPTESRNGGVGFRPDQIAIRGPDTGGPGGQDGYTYLAGTNGVNTLDENSAIADLGYDLQFGARPIAGTGTEYNYCTIQILLDENDLMTVRFDGDTSDDIAVDNLTPLMNLDLSGFTRPETFSLGYVASTGGANNLP